MENDSKDLLIEQLQAQLKQLKQVADSGLLSINNSEDLSGTWDFILFYIKLDSEISVNKGRFPLRKIGPSCIIHTDRPKKLKILQLFIIGP